MMCSETEREAHFRKINKQTENFEKQLADKDVEIRTLTDHCIDKKGKP